MKIQSFLTYFIINTLKYIIIDHASIAITRHSKRQTDALPTELGRDMLREWIHLVMLYPILVKHRHRIIPILVNCGRSKYLSGD